jgi:segregation and condensation protein A
VTSDLPTLQQEPIQQQLPLAFVHGEAVLQRPEDLYIPPDALEVILETFEGPLDFLLYLIRKQKFEIENLPVLKITKQYMEYVERMKNLKLELAAEYLLMAAILAEVKSRVLLPQRPSEDEDEVDPRAELIRRLQEYEKIKIAAQQLNEVPRLDRDLYKASIETGDLIQPVVVLPDVSLQQLVFSFHAALQKAKMLEHHQISREILSTRERMANILKLIHRKQFTRFEQMFSAEEGKAGVVVTFLAILELSKEKLIELVQAEPFAQVHLRLKSEDSA